MPSLFASGVPEYPLTRRLFGFALNALRRRTTATGAGQIRRAVAVRVHELAARFGFAVLLNVVGPRLAKADFTTADGVATQVGAVFARLHQRATVAVDALEFAGFAARFRVLRACRQAGNGRAQHQG